MAASASTTKASPPLPTITSGGNEFIPRTVAVLSKAFNTDPVFNYFLNTLPASQRDSYRDLLFQLMTVSCVNQGGELFEAENFQCAAMLMPPGRDEIDLGLFGWIKAIWEGLLWIVWGLGLSGLHKLMFEYSSLSDGVKAKAFKSGEKYYYLFNIGTNEKFRGKGLSSAIIRAFQERARNDGFPIWLEATTKSSRDIYARLGFQTIDVEVVLGKGTSDANGEKKVSGEGVQIYGMVWWPETKKTN